MNSELRLAWYSLNPVAVQPGEAILSLQMLVSRNKPETVWRFMADSQTGGEEGSGIETPEVNIPTVKILSEDCWLGEVFPNPAGNHASVQFYLPSESKVIIRVCNLLGQPLINPVPAETGKGFHQFDLEGQPLPSGLYLLVFEAVSNSYVFSQTRLIYWEK
ncbi:MAG: T9SS type A sorting domain-containing protein [Bacteroidetes bacterium]|nr:T9SS type A sorting domain-containing protein [Bacteroidota bacterium]